MSDDKKFVESVVLVKTTRTNPELAKAVIEKTHEIIRRKARGGEAGMTPEELAKIIADTEENYLWMVEHEGRDMTDVQAELDRLRHLDKLAREWLYAGDKYGECSIFFDEAREAYRKALDEER